MKHTSINSEADAMNLLHELEEAKKLNSELSDNEEKYHKIFNNMLDVYYEASTDGIILEISPSIETFSKGQYKRAELIGKSLVGLYADPKDRDSFFSELTRSGHVNDYELLMKNKDGSVVPVSISSGLVFDTDGKPATIAGTMRDITERKAMVEALCESELRYRTLADSGQALIWTATPDKKCTYFNQVWLDFTGRTLAQEQGDGWVEGVHPDDLDHCFTVYTTSFDQHKSFSMEYRLRHHDGTWHWLQDDGKPRYDSHGEFIGYIGHCLDITERKKTENKLRETEEKFSTITGQSGDLIGITDMNGIITYASPASASLFLISPEIMCGRRFTDFIADADIERGFQAFRNAMSGAGPVKDTEFCLKRTDGSVFTGEFNGSKFQTGAQMGVLVIIRDITERKQAEAEILNLNANLELKIKERTLQLSLNNENLEKEIQTRNLAETERKRVEELLQWNKSFLELMSNSSPLGFLVVDNRTDEILYFNHRFCQIWEIQHIEDQMQRGELRNNDIIPYCLHVLADIPAFAESCKPLQHEENRTVLEDEIAFSQNRTIRRFTTQMRGDNDEYYGRFYIFEDISARKRSENAVHQSEIKHSTMISNISDVIGIMGVNGVMKYKSPNIEKHFGWKPEDLVGTDGWLTVHPDEVERLQTAFFNLLQTAGSSTTVEYLYKCKDGSYKPIELTATNLVDNAVIGGVLLNYHDITERKLTEEALRESDKRFSLFMDYLPAVVFLKDHEGRTLFVNRYMEDAFGASSWVGKTMQEIFPNDLGEKLMSDDLNSMELGYQKLEESLIQLDGQMHHYETQKFTIDRSDQDAWLGGISLDITKRKEAEAEIIKSRDAAHRANLAKSEFLSRMSHELRTPMNSILGFAQLLDMGELDPKQKKGVGHILNSGKHLLGLIDEVLDISRIESGRLSLFPEPVQLIGIIIEMMDTVQPLADARQLKLELKNSPGSRIYVMSDRKRLKQVMINLLNNAVKYNRPCGSISVKTELMPQNDAGIVSVRISVTDTGLGIHAVDIPKLFIPFERIGAEKTQTEGTGLGLVVVKKIMDAMEGTVGVESIVGEGSTFWIEMPITGEHVSWKNQQENNVELTTNLGIANKEIAFLNEEKAKRAAELVVLKNKYSKEPGTVVPSKTATILYIEDNIQNAELVDEIIRDCRPGIQLITSIYGSTAVKSATENLPDLILLDLDLPDMNGSEVLANLLADDIAKSIPVVILSADATQHQIEKLMTAGARDYLTKPLDINIFLKVVDEWIQPGNSLPG
ncbi:MAG: PAS domain S-box protein [Bacteroidetes bacterium]|nr:PAS domain S-box protein [Bacteroidota bacterium]